MPRFLIFTLVFFFISFAVSAQQDTAFLRFAVEHEELFRRQVSRYYPLSEAMIEKYADDWDWIYLSHNPNLPWSVALIERYADRWSWYALQLNPGISWTDSLIRRYRDRIDWFVLSQNAGLPLGRRFFEKYQREINWRGMSYNSSFLQNERWIKKYKKELSASFRPTAPFTSVATAGYYMKYTEEWRKYHPIEKTKPLPAELIGMQNRPVQEISTDQLERFSDYWDWNSFHKCAELPWSVDFVEKFWGALNVPLNADMHMIYDKIFSPVLSDVFIDRVFERLYPPGTLSFYMIKPQEDIFGAIPTVTSTVEGSDVVLSDYLHRDRLSDDFPNYSLSLERYAPPLRFADFHDWGDISPGSATAIVVSEKTKQVLEHFSLPPHRFYPVSLQAKDEHYGEEVKMYFILHIQRCDYIHFEYDSLEFFWRPPLAWVYSNHREPVGTSLRSPEDYLRLEDSIQHTNLAAKTFAPGTHRWKSAFDVMPCRNEDMLHNIWVSEDVKTALEATGIEGIKFEKVRMTKPRMLGAETEEHRARNRQIIEEVKNKLGHIKINSAVNTIFQQDCIHRDSILSQQGIVKTLAKDGKLPKADHKEIRRLRKKEIEWDILFPHEYKAFISSGKMDNWSQDITQYKFFELDQLIQLGVDTNLPYPYLTKAVLVASDQGQKYLGFILKPDSTYELDGALFQFEYIAGKIFPLGKF